MDNGTILHTFKPKEMFLTFNIDSLEVPKSEVLRYFSDGNKRDFAIFVFKVSLELVINDIIENGVQFQFPNSGKGKSFMCLQRITDTQYQKLRRRGAFKDFDPFEAHFSAYRIEYCVERKKGNTYSIPVHLDKAHSKRIAELARQDKIKVGRVKTYQDYYEDVEKLFPTLSHQDVYRILRYGYNSFRLHLSYGGDVYIQSKYLLLQTGKVYTNQDLMIDYVLQKLKVKIRVMYRRLHFIWDGISYFSLSDNMYDKIAQDLKDKKVVNFGKVVLYKCYDEAFIDSLNRKVILKVPAGREDIKFSSLEELITDKAEIVEWAPKKTWESINFSNHQYQTLLPKRGALQKLYKQNYKPYIKWLRAKRWKELHK